MTLLQTWEIAFHNFSPCIVNDHRARTARGLLECRCIQGREHSGKRRPTVGETLGKYYTLEGYRTHGSWVPQSHLQHSCGFSNDRNKVLNRMLIIETAVKGDSSPGRKSLLQVHMLLPTLRGEGRYRITLSALMGLERCHPCRSH